MSQVVDLMYREQVRDFRNASLNRLLLFLGGMVWLAGSIALLIESTAELFLLFLSFELLCLGSYLLGHGNHQAWAERVFVFGTLFWVAALVYVSGQPLFLALLAVQVLIAANLLSLAETILLTALSMACQVTAALFIFPATWAGGQVLVLPLATLLCGVMARLRELDFETVLVWSLNSTRTAQERLEEVREHRAKLLRNVKDLDDAYRRLERTNEMLVDARSEAERARQARDQFALTVSHELRTPLSFIIGFSEVMVNSPEIYADLNTWPPGLYADIEDIYRSSRHLLNLVNDVLDMGKADANRLILIKEPIRPEAIVEEAAEIMREAVMAKQLWFKKEIEPDLPDLFIDRTRVRQVLINLINNALRFTVEGGITVKVTKCKDEVVFCVSDTGPGIPEEDVPKVFEEFGQSQTGVWRQRDGSGLGIPISQRFVEMHGGRMWLESKFGCGSNFFFSLPLPGTVSWPRWMSEPESDLYWQLKVATNRTAQMLLILSPDPEAGVVFEGSLQGFQVLVVTQVSEALEVITRLLPRGLIIDQVVADRAEVISLLASIPYVLPVLVCPLPNSTAKELPLPEGIVDYLAKPVVRADLLAALKRLHKPVRRLLVIDDEEAMLRFVSLSVRSLNDPEPIEVCGVTTAAETLEYISGTDGDTPDVILLDLGLPDMNGWVLLERIKAVYSSRCLPPPPVILFTAATLQDELDSQRRKSIELYINRPLSNEELSQTIQGILGAIHPHFKTGPDGQAQPENPFEKMVS